MSNKSTVIRKSILWLWIVVVVGCLVFFITHRESFSSEKIAALFQQFNVYMLWAYLAVSLIRGFTLIPSTPFVLAGGILFPGQEWLVLLISLTGIIGSATLIYYFSDLMNFNKTIEKLYPQEKLKQKMESKYGLLFVFLWAFIPIVPTDAVCYAAGAVKMKFISFIFAVLLGELILCSIYVFTGSGLIHLFI